MSTTAPVLHRHMSMFFLSIIFLSNLMSTDIFLNNLRALESNLQYLQVKNNVGSACRKNTQPCSKDIQQ